MCVCVREREREGGREGEREREGWGGYFVKRSNARGTARLFESNTKNKSDRKKQNVRCSLCPAVPFKRYPPSFITDPHTLATARKT